MNTWEVRRSVVHRLLKKFSIEDIEKSLVKSYLDRKNFGSVENEIISHLVSECDKQTVRKVNECLFKENNKINLKVIEKIFELLIPEHERQLNGAFYTPDCIVDYIVNKTVEGKRICDPSCGAGAFLVGATKKMYKPSESSIVSILENNIYGVDILPRSIKRAKIILSLLAITNGEDEKRIDFNLKVADSLNTDWKSFFPDVFKEGGGFDAVIGNPPYIRIQDLNEETKKRLLRDWSTVDKGSFNIYIPFFELGLKIIKEDGVVGYITPNHYFTSLAGRRLRELLQDNTYVREILNFGYRLVFREIRTYTCVTLLDKKKRTSFKYERMDEKGDFDLKNLDFGEVEYSNLDPEKWRVLKKKDFEDVKKIETVGIPLGKIADISPGIATLRDTLYFVNGENESGDFYIKSYAGRDYKIEREITMNILKIPDLDKEEDIKNNKRKIIFPYKDTPSGKEIIREDEFRGKYPNCHSYFLAIKGELAKRDKGKKTYPIWYAYGRKQAITQTGPKLLTRTYSNRPQFMLDAEGGSLYCNGYGIFLKRNLNPFIKSGGGLRLLQKILNSRVMEYYVNKTSNTLAYGYPCYQKNYIERFTIPLLDKDELTFLKEEEDRAKIDQFLFDKYNLTL